MEVVHGLPDDLINLRLTNHGPMIWVTSDNYLVFPLIVGHIDEKLQILIKDFWFSKKEKYRD